VRWKPDQGLAHYTVENMAAQQYTMAHDGTPCALREGGTQQYTMVHDGTPCATTECGTQQYTMVHDGYNVY
jgi:hypothetical protein